MNPASQVIAALLVGLLIVFTCQLLLTNLGLAVGITIWGGQLWRRTASDANDNEVDNLEAGSISLGTLSIAAGLGLLLTVNGVLFVACYAAVKFCRPVTAFSGAILGWVIWSAYMLVMTWVSTQAANSLIAFILSSAVSGFRQIFAVLGSLMQSTLGGQEAALTPAATAELVRQETQLALERIDIPTLIEEYIDEQMPPLLQLETLQAQLEDALQTFDLGSSEQPGFLSQINLNTFTQWVKQEVGLSGDIADEIANLLNQVWQRIMGSRSSPLQQLQDLFSTASVDELLPERVNRILENWQPGDRRQSDAPVSQRLHASSNFQNSENARSAKTTTVVNDISHQLKQILRQRLDLTDLDLQRIWRRIGPLLQDWQPGENIASGFNNQIIREDVDDYLRRVFPWRLNQATLEQEFWEVLVDPQAAADQVLPQLQALNPNGFADILSQRGDLAPKQVDELVADLEAIRQSAIASLRELDTCNRENVAINEGEAAIPNGAYAPPKQQINALAELQQKLENYLRYTSLSQITSDAIAHKIETLVKESPLSEEKLRQASPNLSMAALTKVLDSRRGLDAAQQDQLIQQVQKAWRQYTARDESIMAENVVAAEGILPLSVSRVISGKIDPQDLLPQLLKSLEEGIGNPKKLRRVLSQIDWQAVQKKAQTHLDVPEAQVEQAVQTIQTALIRFLKPPRRWTLRRSAEVKDFWDNLSEYLHCSPPDQLSPTAMRHNLEWLWLASDYGLVSLQSLQTEAITEISALDWSALKDVLARRQDLTTDQIEAIWEKLEGVIQSLLQPMNQTRRRAQASLEAWLASVKAILHDPEKLAVNPGQLKADLRELLQHPPDIFAALIQPLKLLSAAEDPAAAITQLSQDALRQLLAAQGIPKALITQAEGLQTWMQARVAAIEQDIQHRQAVLKHKALEQLDDTRKALATAAWWLFAISITSGTTATVAGILAVTGFEDVLGKLSG